MSGVLWLISAAFPAQLHGSVSNTKGRIGIREDWDRRITRIYNLSPAAKAGLKIGDKIVMVDGRKGAEIVGPPEEIVHIRIQRENTFLSFDIERVASNKISRNY